MPSPQVSETASRGAGVLAVKWLLAALGAALMTFLSWSARDLVVRGLNDFPAFYTAGSLVGTHDLYNQAAFLARQLSLVGMSNANIQFVRLPYYAAFFFPLSKLPYMTAYWLWQTACAAALLGFALLWPNGRRFFPLFFFFPPVAASFANAQDLPFVLFWTAAAVCVASRNRRFLAGLVLSLCLAKPHLFLFAPVALIARKEWKMLAGAFTGVVVLTGASFAVAGRDWIPEMLRVWRDPLVHPNVAGSSAVAAIARSIGEPGFRALFLTAVPIVLAGATWAISRRCDLAAAIAVSIALCVVSAFHAYAQDYSLVLPLGLIMLGRYFPVCTVSIENQNGRSAARSST